MKNKSTLLPLRPEYSEEDIRGYAYHLFQQSNYEPGHDVENWLEAIACLKANIPAHQSHIRLRWHFNSSEGEFSGSSFETIKHAS